LGIAGPGYLVSPELVVVFFNLAHPLQGSLDLETAAHLSHYPNRISMLRTWLQIELGLVKKEDTILGHAMSSIYRKLPTLSDSK
jgi:hypothetical protein